MQTNRGRLSQIEMFELLPIISHSLSCERSSQQTPTRLCKWRSGIPRLLRNEVILPPVAYLALELQGVKGTREYLRFSWHNRSVKVHALVVCEKIS